MTDQNVVERCVEIASKNGWDKYGEYQGEVMGFHWFKPTTGVILEQFIFDHDFAKCLFGEVGVCDYCGRNNRGCKCIFDRKAPLFYICTIPVWQYHIQQLALADDRIDYLREWLQNNHS